MIALEFNVAPHLHGSKFASPFAVRVAFPTSYRHVALVKNIWHYRQNVGRGRKATADPSTPLGAQDARNFAQDDMFLMYCGFAVSLDAGTAWKLFHHRISLSNTGTHWLKPAILQASLRHG